MNRTLMDKERSMRSHAGMPSNFWGVAVLLAARLRNIGPTATTGTKSPYELWHKTKPSVRNLRIFGCVGQYLLDDRNKPQNRTETAIFVGYPPDQAGFRLYHPKKRIFLVSRNVVFDETQLYKDIAVNFINKSHNNCDVPEATESPLTRYHDHDLRSRSDVIRYQEEPRPIPIPSNFRIVVPLFRQPENILPACNAVDLVMSDPQTIKQAQARPDAAQWMSACREELYSLQQHKTWTLV
ncbi:hypothetical protein V1520DRAFT_94538 [Lipomyces starkeyi]